MVDCSTAVEFCYGVWYVDLSTRVLRNENERSVGMLAFISCTEGATSKWCGSDVFRRQGGSPSTTATVMVGSFRVGIPTGIHVGYCTTVGVLPAISYFPNYSHRCINTIVSSRIDL